MPKKAAAAPVTGFQIRPRYREVTCDWFDLEDGEEPLKATIRTNLTFDQVNAIPALTQGVTFEDVWKAITPYISAWNLVGENAETGALEAIPPPAEAGGEVFRATDTAVSLWLHGEVKYAHLGGPKALQKETAAETERAKP